MYYGTRPIPELKVNTIPADAMAVYAARTSAGIQLHMSIISHIHRMYTTLLQNK